MHNLQYFLSLSLRFLSLFLSFFFFNFLSFQNSWKEIKNGKWMEDKEEWKEEEKEEREASNSISMEKRKRMKWWGGERKEKISLGRRWGRKRRRKKKQLWVLTCPSSSLHPHQDHYIQYSTGSHTLFFLLSLSSFSSFFFVLFFHISSLPSNG